MVPAPSLAPTFRPPHSWSAVTQMAVSRPSQVPRRSTATAMASSKAAVSGYTFSFLLKWLAW